MLMSDNPHSWYRCLDCDHVFYEPKKYYESEEMYGAIRSFVVFGCPICAGSFVETKLDEDD